MHNSVTHHLYTVLYVHHPMSSLLPSPLIPALLSSTFPHPFPSGNHHTIVYVHEFLGFFFFLLNPFTFFTQSPKPLSLWQLSVCTLYLWVYFYFISLFCSLDYTYQWDHTVLSFSDWLISLSIVLSRSIHAVTKGKSSFFCFVFTAV